MSSRIFGSVAVIGMTALVAACGGGGGGSATTVTPTPTPAPTPTPTPAPAANTASIVVDNGPAALGMGSNPYVASDSAFVSVTVCVPGTNSCDTVDHVQIDTGSVGLRLYPSAFTNSSVLNALPHQTSPSGNPVGACYGFVDGYIFGGVRTADVTVGGETVAGLPLQIISDPSLPAGVPASCSSGGGNNIATVTDFGANGIYGVWVTTTDCGSACATGSSSSATYYDCPSSGCSTIIARAANTSAPFEQLPNPVAALAVDNNGLIISLPAAAPGGSPSVSGTMYFGIGTETNNGLGSAKILATTNSSNAAGAGFLTATYKGRVLSQSYLDSGSNAFYFVDTSIPTCTMSDFTGYYCPTTPLSLSAAFMAADGSSVAAPFQIYNAQTLFSTDDAALPTLGANPDLISSLAPYSDSFDFGLPFFFGRNIYVAFEDRTAAGTPGPYFAY